MKKMVAVKEYIKPAGAIWVKQGNYGDYLSISLEIDGVKHSYVAYANKFYEQGSNKPQWNIQPPKSQSKPSEVVDKFQAQLDNVMDAKAKYAQNNAKLATIAQSEPELPFTETDIPF